MKKWLIISLFLFFLCGCGKRESSMNLPSSTTTSKMTATSQTTTTISTTSKTVKTTKNKKTTTKSTTTKACISKKFKEPYSYVYKTFLECKKKGKGAFLETSTHIDNVLAYDCKEIIDDCNELWYGIYFYVYNRETDQEEIVHY